MATLKEFLKADRFATCAGVELLEIKPGYARACMEVTDRHLNGGGVCQGGALFTLADLAFAAVANSRKKLTLSVNANITFLRPAKVMLNILALPHLEIRLLMPLQSSLLLRMPLALIL